MLALRTVTYCTENEETPIKPKHNSIVVAIVDGECTVKFLHQRAGRIKLRAANPTYPDIIPRESQTIIVWGVVSGCVKLFPT